MFEQDITVDPEIGEGPQPDGEAVSDRPGIEEEALAQGWRPVDEWDGDPDRWVDAKEFVLRGELISGFKSQLRARDTQLGELRDAFRELSEHHKKVARIEREKAVQELKRHKAAAFEEQDFDRAVDIDDKLQELRSMEDEVDDEPDKPAPSQQAFHPDVATWVETNKWYAEDAVARAAFDAVLQDYVVKNGGDPRTVEPTAALTHATSVLRKRGLLPGGQQRGRSAASDGALGEVGARARASTSGRSRFSERSLTEEQKKYAKTFVNHGLFKNVQEYVDQLAEIGELK